MNEKSQEPTMEEIMARSRRGRRFRGRNRFPFNSVERGPVKPSAREWFAILRPRLYVTVPVETGSKVMETVRSSFRNVIENGRHV